MKIDIVCNDGSPLAVTMNSIYGDDGRVGIGGAEIALLTMCEAWTNAGHEVVLYNDPDTYDVPPFAQRQMNEFVKDAPRDVVITFRSVNNRTVGANGLHVWWSTDQKAVGDFKAFAPQVDKIVTISDYHAEFFKNQYAIENTIVVDLPVRVDDYDQEIAKVPGRCIFTSVPARGLAEMKAVWPRIKALYPETSLVITSDYRLWGTKHPSNDAFRIEWDNQEGVTFMGAIPRRELVVEEMKAQVLSYTCIYDELFCISVAEAQVAGAYPITSGIGAVATTNMGTVIPGSPQNNDWQTEFAKAVTDTLANPDLSTMQEEVKQLALKRFDPKTIVAQWDEKVFK